MKTPRINPMEDSSEVFLFFLSHNCLTVISLLCLGTRAPSPATDAGEGARAPGIGCKDRLFL